MTQAQRQQYQGRIHYWCEDETRLGLFTVQHRQLTGFGIKPVGEVQWQFLYRWLYGFVAPESGASWFMEFSHLDQACFEVALTQFAAQFPDDLHVIQVDNAGAHQADALTLPDNVILLFQPPYCPEVNPLERLWQQLKRALAWMHFGSIAQLQQTITCWVNQLSPEEVKSLTQWDWIVDALCVAGI
ncbi:IS630 family transposase [Gloeocapsopsis crepidinum]|uniref:IS630 family transposase n=1 Tax=Gloeocapsopsis crepidinum TaxID=693223 RepID=UPI001D159780|nr:IS630 family transposase [Gloeocapsopsis crepidinum]